MRRQRRFEPVGSQSKTARIAAFYRADLPRRARHATRLPQGIPHSDRAPAASSREAGLLSRQGKLAEAIRYRLSHSNGFTRFLVDGSEHCEASPRASAAVMKPAARWR